MQGFKKSVFISYTNLCMFYVILCILYYNIQLDMYSCTVLDYYLSVFLTIFISKNSDYTMENIMYLPVRLEGTNLYQFAIH